MSESEIDEQLKNYEEMLQDHPGGKVPLPSSEEVRAKLAFGKADRLYTEWLDGVVAAANVEIVDKSLIEETQPQTPEGHPPMGMPEMPEGHPPMEPPAEAERGAGA